MNNLFEVGDKVRLNSNISLAELEHYNSSPIPIWTPSIIDILLSGFTIDHIMVASTTSNKIIINRIIGTTINNQNLMIPVAFLNKIGRRGHPYTKIFK